MRCREKREKRGGNRDKRELRRQFEQEMGLKDIKKQFHMDKLSKEVTCTFHDEDIHIIFTIHKYNFMIIN